MTKKRDSQWPPTDYEPLAPLQLPVGPTVAIKHEGPLFAASNDTAGVEHEEQTDMFLLQLPGDLRYSRFPIYIDDINNIAEYSRLATRTQELPGEKASPKSVKVGKCLLGYEASC